MEMSEINKLGARERAASSAFNGSLKEVVSMPWLRRIIASVDATTTSSSRMKTRLSEFDMGFLRSVSVDLSSR
jgi:hypothetical protein